MPRTAVFAGDSTPPGVLVVGAYRDNEVDPAHPLIRKLSAIRQAGGTVQEVRLPPLGACDLAHLLADTLHCEPQSAASLAQLIHGKTAGNPFFAIQFIHALGEEGLVSFEHGAGRWRWDSDAIRARGYADNVVDLMVSKLNRLPIATQRALQQLACIGNSAESTVLSAVLETSEQETEAALWEALQLELIVRSEDSYRFAHDRIQEAAYSLIGEEARAEAHLRIGRLLHAHTPPEKHEEAIFEIVNQLNRGAELISSEDERFQVAELNVIAGKRAKASTAYASALKYFIAGEVLLTDAPWERRHDLIFQLELYRAECEFLTGEPAIAAERMEMLRTRASGAVELAMATCVGIDVYMTLGQMDRAIDICLDYLRRIGIDWPLHPTEEHLFWQASYTVAHSVDDASVDFSVESVNDPPESQNIFDRKGDRGPSDFDIRHNFVANVVYGLPGRGRLLGGWQVSALANVHSGLPFTPVLAFDNADIQSLVIPERPDLVGNPYVGVCPNGARVGTPSCWFNPDAFAAPPAGQFGNAGRNILRGPGFAHFDPALHKDFAITERRKITVGAEAYNLFNHPNFGVPSNTQSPLTLGGNGDAVFNDAAGNLAANAGQILTTAGAARQIQLAGRFTF